MQQKSETTEQQAVIEWAQYARKKFKQLDNLYHVPNEGKRTLWAGAVAKSMGLQSGVPDLILDYPMGAYHGMRIEMKFGTNKPTEQQKMWLLRMQEAGYFVAVCWSADRAIRLIQQYCTLKLGERMREDNENAKLMCGGFPAVR